MLLQGTLNRAPVTARALPVSSGKHGRVSTPNSFVQRRSLIQNRKKALIVAEASPGATESASKPK